MNRRFLLGGLFLVAGFLGIVVESSRKESRSETRTRRVALPPDSTESASGTRAAPRQDRDELAGEREIVPLRDAYARHFANPDGTVDALISSSPIHYRAEDGSWQEIATEVARTEHGFENKTNGLQSHFPRWSTGRTTLGLDARRSYHWTPRAVEYTDSDGRILERWHPQNVEARAEGPEVRYPDLFRGATDRFRVGPGAVKHELVLESRPAVPVAADALEYVGEMELEEDLRLRTDESYPTGAFDAVGAIEVHDADGAPLFRLDPVVAIEEGGRGRIAGSYRVRPLGGSSYEVRLRVPAAWIADPARRFPVCVDPTTVILEAGPGESGGVRYHGGIFDEVEWSTYYLDPYGFPLGRDYDWANEYYRAYVAWDTRSVPLGATVQSIDFQTYVSPGNYSEFDHDSIRVQLRSLEYAFSPTWPDLRYEDCADGTVFASNVALHAGEGYTRWIPLTAATRARFAARNVEKRFGIGLTWDEEGDRGVMILPNRSSLRIRYSPDASPLAFLHPRQDQRTTGESVTFRWTRYWTPTSGTPLYALYCDTVPNPSQLLYMGTSNSFTWQVPFRSVRYYWKVVAFSPAPLEDSLASTAVRSFLHNSLPGTPSPLAPLNGSSASAGLQTLVWTPVTDPDGDSVRYYWQIDTTNPPLFPYLASGFTAGASAQVSTMPNTIYSWRVRAYDGHEWSPWSAVRSFSTP